MKSQPVQPKEAPVGCAYHKSVNYQLTLFLYTSIAAVAVLQDMKSYLVRQFKT